MFVKNVDITVSTGLLARLNGFWRDRPPVLDWAEHPEMNPSLPLDPPIVFMMNGEPVRTEQLHPFVVGELLLIAELAPAELIPFDYNFPDLAGFAIFYHFEGGPWESHNGLLLFEPGEIEGGADKANQLIVHVLNAMAYHPSA